MKVNTYNRQDASRQDKILFDSKYLSGLFIYTYGCRYICKCICLCKNYFKTLSRYEVNTILFTQKKKSAKILTSNTPYCMQYLQKVNQVQHTASGLLIGFKCISAQKEKILQRGYLRENTNKLTCIALLSFFLSLIIWLYVHTLNFSHCHPPLPLSHPPPVAEALHPQCYALFRCISFLCTGVLRNISLRCVTFVYTAEYFFNDAKICYILQCYTCLAL